MNRSGCVRSVLALVFSLFLLPAVASAQSAIAGRVTDTSGAVLPGVTVEAASPVLIERVRSSVTDGEGQFLITNLRPGEYTVTFTLSGFQTLRRDAVQVPTDVTVSVNAQMSVGAVEETITVSGAAPTVDVRSVTRTEVVNRELIDLIPTSRDFKGVGATIPTVKTSRQNVGGTASVIQQGLSAHGLDRVNTTSYVDNMNTNSLWTDGGVQMYQNDAMAQEVAYTTSSLGADNSAGGLRVNVIPREGGNQLNSNIFLSRIPGDWQSNNVTQELKDRGLAAGDRIDHIFDLSLSAGFPIKRDKLWLFGSYRRGTLDNWVANTFHAHGDPNLLFTGKDAAGNPLEQGLGTNVNNTYSARLTAQLSPRNKMTAYLDRVIKVADSELTSGFDADTAFNIRRPSNYYIAQAKWTSPITSRFLAEAGWSRTVMAAWNGYSDEQKEERGSPAWYTHVSKTDIVRSTTWNLPTSDSCTCTYKDNLTGSVSYVTGSHSFKTGLQYGFGHFLSVQNRNGDLIQRYRSGVPDSVQVFNTPVEADNILHADIGVYVMDSWTLNRLTLNPGIRFEWLNGTIGGPQLAAGRFVPARTFPEQRNVPDWFDVSPRFSAAYDLFGNAKTALKFGLNKYMAQTQTQFQVRYNPVALASDIRNWNDCAYLPGTSTCDPARIGAPGYHDDIAQDNEIGPSNVSNFGFRQTQRPADDLRREYNIEYTAAIQHELLPGVSTTFGWYRRTFHNLRRTDNLLVTRADYTPFDVVSPYNGEVFQVYNLNRNKQGAVDLVDTISTDGDLRGETYQGFEVAGTIRLPRGGAMYGGITGDRNVAWACDGYDPNTLRFCDQRDMGLPFRYDFKLTGSYPLPYDVQIGFSFQSYAGSTAKGGSNTSISQAGVSDGWLQINWNVPANLFPNGQRTQTVTVPLIPPGVQSLDRFNQLDLSFNRSFKFGKYMFRPSLDLFNAFNSNVVLNQNQNQGPSLGQPTEILQGRLIRVAALFQF